MMRWSALFLCLLLPTLAMAQSVPQSRQQITMSFAPVVKQVAPAVVNIYAERMVTTRTSPFMNDPIFQQLFGDQLNMGVPRRRVESALGSGVIVRGNGWVVTNKHVIAGADDIKVVLSDRREYPAEVKLVDDKTDLAVLKINAQNLPSVRLGNSDNLEVGDLVLAIGNPFGVGQTVTSGIVSATSRTGTGITDYGYFIQTDAAINPGNSGGALVDMAGELVGINTAIYSASGGSLGIGFAIPANLVATVIEAGAVGQKPIRPWLGVAVEPMTAELAASLGLERPQGVIVKSVHPASPTGLRVGDVITSLNGRAVDDAEALKFRAATERVGASVTLGGVRKGRAFTRDFILITAPDSPPRQPVVLEGRHPFAGATVVNLNPAVVEEFGLTEDLSAGVLITAVARRSPAEFFGLEPGDMLLALNRSEVKNTEQLQAILDEPRPRWQVRLRRGERVITSILGG